ncbi:MAG: extracellular matrix regulator RemB [Acutalibacteraceae bacterium]
MYINIAGDYILKKSEIIGIFDIDKITVYKSNRNYLSRMEKRGKIISVTDKIPKSFLVCGTKKDSTVYISNLMPSTIYKRNE